MLLNNDENTATGPDKRAPFFWQIRLKVRDYYAYSHQWLECTAGVCFHQPL